MMFCSTLTNHSLLCLVISDVFISSAKSVWSINRCRFSILTLKVACYFPVFLWQYIVSFLCRQSAPEAYQLGILRQWTPHQKTSRIQESPSRLEYYSSRVRRVGGEERINEQLRRATVKKRTLLLCNQLTDWWKTFIQDVYILNNKTLGVWPHKAGVFQL